MAHNNHQDDRRSNNGRSGGEYNKENENVRIDNHDEEQQQQQFVSPSLCIPRTHANIRRGRLFAVFRSLGLGWIGRIDMVEKQDEKTGAPFIRVFIHFTKWFPNNKTRQFLDHLETKKSANIVYDDPWYWKVTKSFVPAPQPQQPQQQQPSRFPKPRIDLVGPPPPPPATTTVSVSKPQTPSSASTSTDASTTAVSGKGKQVAKRMGYESGKGLGKKADGRLVPVQIKKNTGRNGIGLGTTGGPSTVAVDSSVHSDHIPSSEEYWTKVAQQATTLSVSISPPKVERMLFCDNDDVIASASAPATASSHDVSMAAAAIWQATLSKST